MFETGNLWAETMLITRKTVERWIFEGKLCKDFPLSFKRAKLMKEKDCLKMQEASRLADKFKPIVESLRQMDEKASTSNRIAIETMPFQNCLGVMIFVLSPNYEYSSDKRDLIAGIVIDTKMEGKEICIKIQSFDEAAEKKWKSTERFFSKGEVEAALRFLEGEGRKILKVADFYRRIYIADLKDTVATFAD
ncbi:MAG: hypothetical protein N3E51_00945 [Candidatus Micrarchaeota archaeon]|nr:hypothetical protein [Candidatus Micrarchaeota archaeon]